MAVTFDSIGITSSTNGGVLLQNVSGTTNINALNLVNCNSSGLLVSKGGTLNISGGSNSINTTSGRFLHYFDGSDVFLGGEDLEAVWIDGVSGEIYLTTYDSFSVPGVSGDNSDVFICEPISLGGITSCTFSLFWDGSASGFGSEWVDGFSLAAGP